jgi:hypothetical protein
MRVGCRLLAAHTQLGSDDTQVSVRAATQVKTQLVRAAATRIVIDAIEGDNVSSRIQSLYVQAQRLHFLHKYLEGLRDAGLRNVLTLNNGFIHLYTTDNVVRLDGQEFL